MPQFIVAFDACGIDQWVVFVYCSDGLFCGGPGKGKKECVVAEEWKWNVENRVVDKVDVKWWLRNRRHCGVTRVGGWMKRTPHIMS